VNGTEIEKEIETGTGTEIETEKTEFGKTTPDVVAATKYVNPH